MAGHSCFLVRGWAVVALVLLLPACSSTRLDAASSYGWMPSWLRPYRMDIVQGTVITREQVQQLKTGQTRPQVREILGSPLLADPFHAARWDYVFTIDRPGLPPQRRSVVVHFDGERLDRVEASDLPSEREFIAAISRPAPDRAPPALVLTPEQLQALPRPAASAASATAATVPGVPPRVYPPLEPS
jgi:outer membrane protein assembly factor BamE